MNAVGLQKLRGGTPPAGLTGGLRHSLADDPAKIPRPPRDGKLLGFLPIPAAPLPANKQIPLLTLQVVSIEDCLPCPAHSNTTEIILGRRECPYEGRTFRGRNFSTMAMQSSCNRPPAQKAFRLALASADMRLRVAAWRKTVKVNFQCVTTRIGIIQGACKPRLTVISRFFD
jgi:hypothetical protein